MYTTLNIPIVMWLMRSFFKDLPFELIECAMLEGAPHHIVFTKIVLPLSKVGLATTAFLLVILTWNEFFFALILTNGSHSQTAPLNVAYAGAPYIVLSILPALVLALIFQRSIRSLNIVDPL